jgi:hypothetical protein
MKIATIENRDKDIMYAIEESDCIMRIFCPGHHPFKMHLHNGGAEGILHKC